MSPADCWGILTQEVKALHDSYTEINRNTPSKTPKGRIFISKAVILLCLAKKSRDADHLQNFVYDQMAGIDADALADELTYLDRMRPGHAFLGTTNLDLSSLTERFQTRFQSIRLQPPDNKPLAAFLARRWGAPISITRQIAEGAKGNVRAAMADLEMWIG